MDLSIVESIDKSMQFQDKPEGVDRHNLSMLNRSLELNFDKEMEDMRGDMANLHKENEEIIKETIGYKKIIIMQKQNIIKYKSHIKKLYLDVDALFSCKNTADNHNAEIVTMIETLMQNVEAEKDSDSQDVIKLVEFENNYEQINILKNQCDSFTNANHKLSDEISTLKKYITRELQIIFNNLESICKTMN